MGNCFSSTQVQETKSSESSHPLLEENLANGQCKPSPEAPSENDVTCPLEIEPGNLSNTGYLLHQAIVHNDVNGCNNVLQAGFDPDRPLKYQATLPGKKASEEDRLHYEFQGTALHVACIYRRPEIVQLLLEHSADPNVTDKFGRTPIILTVTYWPRVILEHWPEEADKSSEENRYYYYLKELHIKSYNCLQSLCQFQADVTKTYQLGQTALHLAARYHLSSCVDTLLRYGACINATDHKAHIYCSRGWQSVVFSRWPVYYINLGRSSKFAVAEGAQHINASLHSFAIATKTLLLSVGLTPLHYVCNRATHNSDGKDIVKMLVENGANVNLCDDDGNTALHLAAINGCGDFIEQLVKFGANPDQINFRGLSPLFLLLDDIRNVGCIKGLNTILNDSTYIRIFDEHHHLPALLSLPELKSVRAALLDTASMPPLLKLVCRRTIRSSIGIHNMVPETVNQLPCPPPLKTFILSQHNNFEIEVNSNAIVDQAIIGG